MRGYCVRWLRLGWRRPRVTDREVSSSNLHRITNRPILGLLRLGCGGARLAVWTHGVTKMFEEGCAMQHKRFGFGLATLAASALFVSGCSNATNESQSSASSTTSAAASASASPSAASSDAAHNDADVTFAQGMILIISRRSR